MLSGLLLMAYRTFAWHLAKTNQVIVCYNGGTQYKCTLVGRQSEYVGKCPR